MSKPLFQSVATQLRERIAAGEWTEGGRLPTEQLLAAEYSVGINTVRRAVEELVGEGLVSRRQGSGTFVTTPAAAPDNPSRFIGVIVPSTSYYFPSVIAGIEKATGAVGARMLLASSGYDPAVERIRIQEMLDSGVAGLIMAPTLHLGTDHGHLDALRALPIPAVLIERRPVDPEPDDSLSFICTDADGGGYAAVRHLIDEGCTRIGYLGRSDTATAEAVFAGFRGAVERLGAVAPESAIVRRPRFGPEALEDYARIAEEEQLDGVFCLGDREATALLPRLRARGLSVPNDIAVVAYDDEVAELAEVPLSAVAPPKTEIGRLAAVTLLRQIVLGTDAPVVRTVLQPTVTRRTSSLRSAAPAPHPDHDLGPGRLPGRITPL